MSISPITAIYRWAVDGVAGTGGEAAAGRAGASPDCAA